MRLRELMLTTMAMVLPGLDALAGQDSTCKAWQPEAVTGLERISILKSMAVVTIDGRDETVRMARGHLDLRVIPDETGIYVVYGKPVKTDDGPAFGPRITVQRLIYDPARPKILQTDCEARK